MHILLHFDKLVVPIKNYGCEVRNFHMTTNIEHVQITVL